MIEDVSPIKKSDFPARHVSFLEGICSWCFKGKYYVWKSTGTCMSLALEVQPCQSGILWRFLVYLEYYKAGPVPIVINEVKQPPKIAVSKWLSLWFFHPTFWGLQLHL